MTEQRYFSDATISVLAEVANRGGCSFVINSILNDLPDRLKDARKQPYYQTAHIDGLVAGEYFESKSGVFQQVGQKNELANGVPYALGFSENTFGVYSVEMFIPLIHMFDRRGENDTCSYAICDTAFGKLEDSVVSTELSERTVVLAVHEERGLVVAKDVLLMIREFIAENYSAVQYRRLGRDTTHERSQLQEELEHIFNVPQLVAGVTGFSPDVDYKEEYRLRKQIERIVRRVGGISVHEEVLVDYQEEKAHDGFSAKDYAEKTLLRRNDVSGGYNILTQFIFPAAQSREPLTALDVFISDKIGVATVNKTIEPQKGTDSAFDFIEGKIAVAAEGDIVKGVVLESFSLEVQEWAHQTYQELTDHFAKQFPEYHPQFSLVYLEEDGIKRLVITDISTNGLDLATGRNARSEGYYYGSDRPRRKWKATLKDDRLHYRSASGRKIKTNRHMDEEIAAGILELNHHVDCNMWLTDKSVKQPFLNHKKKIVNVSRGGLGVFNGKRWGSGSDISFRPVVECPLDIS